MSIRTPQNPGIGGLDELTNAEEAFITDLAGLAYTQGDILYHDGTKLNVDNTNLFWDGTNKRLGLGTNTPATTLEVNGKVRIIDDLELRDDKKLHFDTAKTRSIRYSTDHGELVFPSGYSIATEGALGFYANTSADASGNWEPYIEFCTDGSVYVSNSAQGNNKSFELDMPDGFILGTTGFYSVTVKADNIATTGKTFQFPNVSGTLVTTAGALADVNLGDGYKLITDEVRAYDAAGLKLYDDGGNGIFVEDGGQVGIGTVTPAAELDVIGTTLSDKLSTGDTTYIAGGNYFFTNSFDGWSIERWAALNDSVGNSLFYGDVNGGTLTTSGTITNPHNSFRPGDFYSPITNVTSPIVVTLEKSLASDSNVNEQRAFLQAHTSLTATIKVELKKADLSWVTLSEEAVTLSNLEYWFSDNFGDVVTYPGDYGLQGVRYTITGLTQAQSYIRQLGIFQTKAIEFPFLPKYQPDIQGQVNIYKRGTTSLLNITDSSLGDLLKIDRYGRMGIGDSTPIANLELAYGVNSQGYTKGLKNNYIELGTTDTNRYPYIGFNMHLRTSDSLFNPSNAAGQGILMRTSTGSGGLRISGVDWGGSSANKNPNTFTEIAYFNYDGKVGMGTTSPDTSLQVVGDTKLGDDNTNYASFATDGELTLTGTARVKSCAWIDAASVKAPLIKPATYITHGLNGAWSFADAVEANQETLSAGTKIPDGIDITVAPSFKIAWSADGVSPGNVKWQFEYVWRSLNEDTTAAAQETLTLVSTASSTANGLCSAEITGIDLPSATDKCLYFKITRLSADTQDTIADTVELLCMCLEYTKNKLGEAT